MFLPGLGVLGRLGIVSIPKRFKKWRVRAIHETVRRCALKWQHWHHRVRRMSFAVISDFPNRFKKKYCAFFRVTTFFFRTAHNYRHTMWQIRSMCQSTNQRLTVSPMMAACTVFLKNGSENQNRTQKWQQSGVTIYNSLGTTSQHYS